MKNKFVIELDFLLSQLEEYITGHIIHTKKRITGIYTLMRQMI